MIIKLGEEIEEYTLRNKKDEDIPVYSVTNDKGFCTGYFSKDVSSKDQSTYKIVPYGCFAYNPSRINVGSVDWQHCEDKVIVSPLYVVFKVSNKINPQYLYYYLKSDIARTYIKATAAGSVRDNLKFSMLKEFPFNLRTLEEQSKIVKVLERVENNIELCKKRAEYLDTLVKSRFIEMFGDPVVNQNNLPVVKLGDLSELITKGASPSWQGFTYTKDNSQTLFITSENVREGYIDLLSPKYIENGFNEKQKRSIIKKGDFLINIVGASIGRAAQFQLECKANMNQAAALVRINDARVRDKYLLIYLNSDGAKLMYDSMKSDTGRANLSLQDVSDLLILLPSIQKQIEFEEFVNQTDKSKLAVQKSLDELETLKKSLMQEYFG